jgi:antitoxin MazE
MLLKRVIIESNARSSIGRNLLSASMCKPRSPKRGLLFVKPRLRKTQSAEELPATQPEPKRTQIVAASVPHSRIQQERNSRDRYGRPMQLSKWGNSLAVRIPATIVKALDLKEGDEITIRVGSNDDFNAAHDLSQETAIERRLRQMKWSFPLVSNSTVKKRMNAKPFPGGLCVYCENND